MRGRRTQGTGALVVGVVLSAVATLAAQSPPRGFISSRYGSHTSSVIFLGYTVGPVTPVFAIASNPHDGYREEVAGLFRLQHVNRHLGFSAGVAGANNSDGWFGQLYLSPTLTAGRVRSELRFKLYLPLERDGYTELSMNPSNVLVDLGHGVSAGGMVVWSAAHGEAHAVGAGPSLRLRIPNGSIAVDGVFDVTQWTNEYRVGFTTTY